MRKVPAQPPSEQKLDRAMRLFWERGYYDTSIEDIIARTGLNRAAIYGEFGSKKKLFEALLLRYRNKVTAALLAPLNAPDAALAHLQRFFSTLHDFAAAPDGHFGCLMCNTACEVSDHVRSIARIVSTYLDDLGALFRRACVNARERGEMRSELDPDQVADYLTGSVLGTMALARVPATHAVIAHYVGGVKDFLNSLQAGGGDGEFRAA